MIWRVILFLLLGASLASADLPRQSQIANDSLHRYAANPARFYRVGLFLQPAGSTNN